MAIYCFNFERKKFIECKGGMNCFGLWQCPDVSSFEQDADPLGSV